MSSEDLLLGIDCGTEGARAAIVDPAGRVVAFARAPYPTSHPRLGWAEQEPEDWWQAVGVASRDALSKAGVSASAVRGVAATCTSCSVVASDSQGRALRPALIWMDVRAAAQAERIGATGDPALKYSGYGRPSAEWFLCKALWLAEHEPDVYERASHISEFTDWLGHQLTGEWVASINTASIRGYYDRAADGWPVSLFEAVGLPDLIEKLPPTVKDMGSTLGTVTEEAARHIGVVPGTPVAVGGADAFVGMVGLDVLAPGRIALITGSSHLQLAQTSSPTYAEGMFGAYSDAVVPGQYTIEGGQISTGSVTRWFAELCRGAHFEPAAIPSEKVFRTLEQQASKIRPGSDGVMALEFWQGSRTPYIDPHARGMLWGLTLAHTPAHIYRAILEAVCFGTENVFRSFRMNGHELTDIVAAGGALNSELWMQIHADVLGLPISVPAVPEAVSLGAAVLASVVAGLHPDVSTAATAMVSIARQIEPDARAHDAYEFLFDVYIESYSAMKDLMHTVAARGAVNELSASSYKPD